MGRLYKDKTEVELAALLCKSDPNALAEIYRRFSPVIFRHAVGALKDEELAKDVLQDIFKKLWEKRDTIQIRSSLAGYLFIMVRNSVLANVGRAKIESTFIEAYERRAADTSNNSTESYLHDKELRKTIEAEIARLPPRMREVFNLSQSGDLSLKEVSQLMNLSEQTVKNQMHSALKQLRVNLKNFMLTLF